MGRQASETRIPIKYEPQLPKPSLIVLPPRLHGRLHPFEVSYDDHHWGDPARGAAEDPVSSRHGLGSPASSDAKHKQVKFPETMSVLEKPLEGTRHQSLPSEQPASERRRVVQTGGVPQPVRSFPDRYIIAGEIARAQPGIGRHRSAVVICDEVDDGALSRAGLSDEDDIAGSLRGR